MRIKERRKFERYKAPSGAYVMFGQDACPCQILDISQGGIALLFVDKGDVLKSSFELALILDEEEIRIEKIPYEIITSFSFAREMSLGGEDPIVRVGLRFGEMTQSQKMQLKHFLWFASTTEM